MGLARSADMLVITVKASRFQNFSHLVEVTYLVVLPFN